MSLKKYKSTFATAAGLAMLLTTVGFGSLPASANNTCTVTVYTDGTEAGTLRHCLANLSANQTSVIEFDATTEQVISLSGALVIDNRFGSLEINGGGNVVIERASSVAPETKFPLLHVNQDFSVLEIYNLTFRNADNSGGNGGAIFVDEPITQFFVDGNTFENNKADNGGAIYSPELSQGSFLYLGKTEGGPDAPNPQGNHFENNVASGDGGAVWTDVENGMDFFRSTAISNSAVRGGAIYSAVDRGLQVFDSHFELNSAAPYTSGNTGNGGAIFTVGTSTSYIDVQRNTFTSNSAAYHGGAIASQVAARVQNSFFDSNRAFDYGGALYLANDAVVDFSTFVDNDSDSTDTTGSYEHGRSIYVSNATAHMVASLFLADTEGLGEAQIAFGNSGSVEDAGYNVSTYANETELDNETSSKGVDLSKLGMGPAVDKNVTATGNTMKIREFSSIENAGVIVPESFNVPEVSHPLPNESSAYTFNSRDVLSRSKSGDRAPGAVHYSLNSGGGSTPPPNVEEGPSNDGNPSFSAPTPFQGPVVSGIGGSSGTANAEPGEVISLNGSNLETVIAVTVGGLDAEVESTETGVGFVVPTGLDIGTYDLTVTSDAGTVTISDAINITVASTEGYGALKAWTKRISETEAKVYVKFPQVGNRIQITHQTGGSGEYSPVVTRTVSSTTDEFLTINSVGTYFVRTIDLEDINRIRVIVDGEKLVQVIYQ